MCLSNTWNIWKDTKQMNKWLIPEKGINGRWEGTGNFTWYLNDFCTICLYCFVLQVFIACYFKNSVKNLKIKAYFLGIWDFIFSWLSSGLE